MNARSSLWIALGLIAIAQPSLAQAQAQPPVATAPAADVAPPAEPAPAPDPALAPAPEGVAPNDELPPAPPPPPAAESAPSPYAAEPQYDGQVDAQGRAHYGEQTEPAYEDPEYVEPTGDDSDRGGGGDFEMPPFSIRFDPFNWLIEGRLGFELEVGVLKWLSVELVPVFVADPEPPSFNLSGRDDAVSQESNGLGPIAGASLGVGLWPQGKPLEGYVIRLLLTNYGFTYNASDNLGVFDSVDFTERRFMAYFGSHTRFGWFTIAGGIGLGYELNQQQRCFINGTAVRSGCSDDGEQHIALEDPDSVPSPAVADLNGPLHPIYLEGRLSIGVAFD